MGTARLRAEDNATAGDVAAGVRLTLCSPGFRTHVEAILTQMVIPDVAFRELWYLVIGRSSGRLVDAYAYSVAAGTGYLRLRSADGNVALFRRWQLLAQLSTGVLRERDIRECRVLAVKPSLAHPRRRQYRPDEPIGPEGNRTLRARLAELRRRREAETA